MNGLNSSISTPPAKLDKLPCKAKPTAKDAAPNIAIKLVVAIPTIEDTVTRSKTFRKALTKLHRNRIKDISTSLLISIFLNQRLIREINHHPITNVSIAAATFGKYVSPNSVR